MDKIPNCPDVVGQLLRKRQAFAYKPGYSLPEGAVETLNMIGLTAVFAHRSVTS